MRKNTLYVFWVWLAVAGFWTIPAYAADKDNNPPGPTGGPGTNWENPPGPQGGPGASPDHNRRHWKEKADTNQDGTVDESERAAAKTAYQEKREEFKEKLKEKADTNHDGTIDKAERHEAKQHIKHRDRDNNPPGPKGGKGTNWENPPGAKGGRGASPNRRRY